ncbi:hypothetical protein GCM10023238_22660 [Streptomyces heliomycini]
MLRQLDALAHGLGTGATASVGSSPIRGTRDVGARDAAAHLRTNVPGAHARRFPLGAETDDDVTAAADAILARVRDGSYRYAPDGAFGEAGGRAWESARWGHGHGVAADPCRAARRGRAGAGPAAPSGLLGTPCWVRW